MVSVSHFGIEDQIWVLSGFSSLCCQLLSPLLCGTGCLCTAVRVPHLSFQWFQGKMLLYPCHHWGPGDNFCPSPHLPVIWKIAAFPLNITFPAPDCARDCVWHLPLASKPILGSDQLTEDYLNCIWSTPTSLEATSFQVFLKEEVIFHSSDSFNQNILNIKHDAIQRVKTTTL